MYNAEIEEGETQVAGAIGVKRKRRRRRRRRRRRERKRNGQGRTSGQLKALPSSVSQKIKLSKICVDGGLYFALVSCFFASITLVLWLAFNHYYLSFLVIF